MTFLNFDNQWPQCAPSDLTFPTQCIYVSHMILKINSDYFLKQH